MRFKTAVQVTFARALVTVLLASLIPLNAAGPAKGGFSVSSISVPSGLSAPAPFSPSTNSMQLYITPPLSDGGANIEEWEFIAYPGRISNSIFTNTLSNWESLGLNPSTTYSFTVRFRNAAGWSEESARSVSISTLALPAQAPTQSTTVPTVIETPVPVVNRVPIPIRLSVTCVPEATATRVTLFGERLDSITSASVDGKPILLANVSPGSIDLTLPGLPTGSYDLVYLSSLGSVVQQGALRVCATSNPSATESATTSATTSPSTSPTSSPPTPSKNLVRGTATAFFNANSAVLTTAARRSLDSLAEAHRGMRSSFAAVEGFAASPSSPAFARSLAQRRATAVLRYLRAIGVNAFFSVEVNISSSSATALDRRVEVRLTSRPN